MLSSSHSHGSVAGGYLFEGAYGLKTFTSKAVIPFLLQNVSVEPHAFAETLLRGDLIFHEFIHKRALRIMSSRTKRTVLFIELRRVMLYALYLAQAFPEGAVIAIRSHVAFLPWLTEL